MATLDTNKNFPLPAVTARRQLGHDVLTIQETSRANVTESDEAGLAFALSQNRALVTLNRAAALAKADLAMNMVVEMTSLQGAMGAHYALRGGEPREVAAAIAEQYDAVSGSPAAMALAIAERLNSLDRLFAAGLGPEGSNDSFALRRRRCT